MRERQITFGKYGHTLNHRQVLSPDGQWVAYDTRNEDSHIATTDAVEMVHIDSGDVVRLYQTPTQSLFGPGVGAVAFHPHERRVVFIHGLENNSRDNKYSAARRFGALVDVQQPNIYIHAEARSLPVEHAVQRMGHTLRVQGALSGGTHAHSWNDSGWLSFTYNDAWLECQSKTDNTVRDIRSVGFMVPGMPIAIEGKLGARTGEEFSGTFAAFLAATVKPLASWGSDEIEYAVEECWIGKKTSLAFLGGVRDIKGTLVNEIFVCKLPSQPELLATAEQPDELALHAEVGLRPIANCKQRRLTYTADRRFPGVQGLRNWLVSSPNGETVYATMKDDRGVVQVFGINTTNGAIQQITDLEHSIEGQISLDAVGTTCSFHCRQRIGLTVVSTGEIRWLNTASPHQIVGAVHFLETGRLVYNRRVESEREGWLQIFVCEIG